jgi:hypothetical protein
VIDVAIDKKTANHAAPKRREPRMALIPISLNLAFTSVTNSPYATVTPTVAVVIKRAES